MSDLRREMSQAGHAARRAGRTGWSACGAAWRRLVAARRAVLIWSVGAVSSAAVLGMILALSRAEASRQTAELRGLAGRLGEKNRLAVTMMSRDLDSARRESAERLQRYTQALAQLSRQSSSPLVRGARGKRRVALTFDDGPHAGFTERILDLLKEHGVRATFFVVGEKVAESPDLLRRQVSAGHEIGNHTYHHYNLTTLSSSDLVSELERNHDLIRQVCGVETRLFRPPGGQYNPRVLRLAQALEYKTVLWSGDAGDYTSPPASVVEERILGKIGGGVILLCHDGIQGTLDALPRVIRRLKSDGYQFVTVSELIKEGK